jgi:late competence protein required for DNA uptake (superfamily II DNA/RNA helicase)
MKRKDGRHILLTDYFGSNVLKPDVANTLEPKVEIINTRLSLAPGQPWAKKINTLLYDPDYQEYVALLAAKKISEGHSVLVIADRVEFLENVERLLGKSCILVTGTTNSTAEEREKVKQLINSGEKDCVAGSRQIFSEGISIDRLSCVILAVPIANEENLEQIIGRIMRQFPNKPQPLVVDLHFNGTSERKQNNIRMGFYMKQGWQIQGN